MGSTDVSNDFLYQIDFSKELSAANIYFVINFKVHSRSGASMPDKKITSLDLLEAHFAQVEKLDSGLNMVIWQDREAAPEIAWQRDREKANG